MNFYTTNLKNPNFDLINENNEETNPTLDLDIQNDLETNTTDIAQRTLLNLSTNSIDSNRAQLTSSIDNSSRNMANTASSADDISAQFLQMMMYMSILNTGYGNFSAFSESQ